MGNTNVDTIFCNFHLVYFLEKFYFSIIYLFIPLPSLFFFNFPTFFIARAQRIFEMKLYRKINFRYLIILLFFRNGKIKKRKKGFLLRLILRACDIGISYSREIRIRARYNRIIIYFDTVSAKLLSVFATQIIHGCCYCAFLRLSLSLSFPPLLPCSRITKPI